MAPQLRLYISEDQSKRLYNPRTDDIPDGFELRPFICPDTGDTWAKRKYFWVHIDELELTPDKMTYDRVATCENTDLMDKSHLEWLWINYFEEKMKKKELENLVGLINLELYIILLKVYRRDMDIAECLEGINSKKTLKAISLFSGMGGDSLGIVNSGLELTAYSEWEKEMKETHELNFPKSQLLGDGDITKISDEEFLKFKNDIDLIFAGFPCQGFSHAGKKLPDDPRNTLFREFLRSTKLINPKYVIGENVKGLLSRKTSEGKLYIDVIKSEFDQIGYDIKSKVYMCSKLDIGVPQNRERLLIVGIRKDLNQKYTFPEELDGKIGDLKHIIQFDMTGALHVKPEYLDFDLNDIPKECILTDENNDEGENNPHPNLVQLAVKRDYERKGISRPHRLHFGRRLDVGGEIIDIRKPINTIICSYAHCPRFFVPLKNKKGYFLRTLLPDELKQIQGFPKDYKLSGNVGKQIKQIGNAVPPPLIQMIVESLINAQ
tara:strand:+ start:2886 stop:4361 length:1476 start_codon:yes stop_codon:yes gene_type:complete